MQVRPQPSFLTSAIVLTNRFFILRNYAWSGITSKGKSCGAEPRRLIKLTVDRIQLAELLYCNGRGTRCTTHQIFCKKINRLPVTGPGASLCIRFIRRKIDFRPK